MNIIFERDSVCAGDDVTAPNRVEQSFDDDATWQDVLNELIVGRYLPSVSKSKTYWSVLNEGQKIADVTHSALIHIGVSVQLHKPDDVADADVLFFRYQKQDPVRQS